MMLAQDPLNPSKEDLEALDKLFEEHALQHSLMIYLQQVQITFGYIPEFSMRYLSKRLNVSESHIYGVITFYAQFSMKPVGKNIVKVCHGTACHVGGSKALSKKLRSHLKLSEEEETTSDRVFTVQNVACLGCCALAPAMMVNGKVYGKLDVDRIKEVIETYRKASESEDL
jgi:NADH-quinone oxidoreductase subunit E